MDDRGLQMLLEDLLDLLVEGLQPFMEGEDAGGELGDDGGWRGLGREHLTALWSRRRHGRRCWRRQAPSDAAASRLDGSGQRGGFDLEPVKSFV
jgi:hypothetical protein